jgi:predicted NBD/HSP70 family sugar kinase
VIGASAQKLEDTSPERVMAAIEAAVENLQEASGRPIATLGINLPGIVDADRDTVRFSPLLGWSRVRLGSMLHDRLGLPVLVENDVNALALAEAWFGHGRKHDSFLVMTLGRGIGLGIVLEGDVYRGPTGGAGEFGHVLLDPNGPDTRHANRGTIEAYLSDDALVREARERIPSFPASGGPEQLVEFAHRDDAGALAVLDEAGRTMGRALATLIDIFAPPLIVLSGEGMRAAKWLIPPARRELRRLSFGDLADHVEIKVAPWGDDAWARGAAGLAASRYLVDEAVRMGGE